MLPPTSTFGLLHRLHNGDQEAFSSLFRRYSPRLAVHIHYKIGSRLRGRLEVEDILQETFFAAHRSVGQFTYRSPGSFMSWLARIADHVITDAARFHGRQKRQPGEMLSFRTDSNPGGAEAADTLTPSRILLRRERLQGAIAALDALPEDYRRVILLARVIGLSTQEIAQQMGRPREYVAVLLHRAVKKLRQLARTRETS